MKKTKRADLESMVRSHLRVEKIRIILKKALKVKGLTYEDLAVAMNVSLPTVKRMLTKEDLSLSRLFAICEIAGVSFGELSQLVDESVRAEENDFTVEQEEFFAKHPHYLSFLTELSMKKTPAEIQKERNLTARSLQMYLTKLEVLNLVKRKGERWLPIHEVQPNWRRNGALAKSQLKVTLSNAFQFFNRRLDRVFEDSREKFPMQFSLMMQDCPLDLAQQFRSQIAELMGEFEQKTKVRELSSSKSIKSKFVLEMKSVFLAESDPDVQTNFFFGPIKNL